MPTAVPIISLFVAGASTAVSAYGQARAGKEEERAKKEEARRRRIAAGQRADITEKEHRRLLAQQRARYGASGLTMEGSPLLVQLESMRESEEELTRIRAGGEMLASEAERAGRGARRAGYVGAFGETLRGGTLLSRIGREYDWW